MNEFPDYISVAKLQHKEREPVLKEFMALERERITKKLRTCYSMHRSMDYEWSEACHPWDRRLLCIELLMRGFVLDNLVDDVLTNITRASLFEACQSPANVIRISWKKQYRDKGTPFDG